MSHGSDAPVHRSGSVHGPALVDVVSGLDLPPEPARAVDVGCGVGDDVRWLAGAGFDVIGIDTNSQTLKIAADRTPADTHIEWLKGNATSLQLPDESCVLVTDRGCLHHLPLEQQGLYAEQVHRVLVPGGAWVIRDAIGHHHQVAELDADAIGELARRASLRVESCDVTDSAGSHTWLVAVLRRD